MHSKPNSFQQEPKLQAALAHAGVGSRRQAEGLIAAGRVSVNGQPAHLGQRLDPDQDQVRVDGRLVPLKPAAPVYVLINKPVGYVSTTSDELGRPTVLHLLPPELRQQRLYPVGRLDIDSQGLLLLTNDGPLAYRLTHPKFEIMKTYHLTLDRAISEPAFAHLKQGVKLSDGWAKPRAVSSLGSAHRLSLSISEGRNRQVRRMLERVGYQVVRLERVQFGPWLLSDLEGQQLKLLDQTAVSQVVKD